MQKLKDRFTFHIECQNPIKIWKHYHLSDEKYFSKSFFSILVAGRRFVKILMTIQGPNPAISADLVTLHIVLEFAKRFRIAIFKKAVKKTGNAHVVAQFGPYSGLTL